MLAQTAQTALDALLADATAVVRALVAVEGRVVPRLLDREQRAAHGLAWLATCIEAFRQTALHAERLREAGTMTDLDEQLARIGLGEMLAQIFSGIPMSQSEIARLSDLGVPPDAVARRMIPEIDALIRSGNTAARRANAAELLRAAPGTIGSSGLDDTLESIRDEMRRFADSEIAPVAQRWHLDDALIPDAILAQLAELGVFGLTLPDTCDGAGLGKEAMCVVSEELSRAFLGAGSLGTRSEIAAELILSSGTEAQKRRWLPKIASGAVLPTAVFTEPEAGSDLAAIRTRAKREGEVYRVTGQKTWITHAARADLMTLLVRTDPSETGHHGLSILLAEKPRGTDADAFPVAGLTGSEIPVIGYRGMKEYDLAFDRFIVEADELLGGVEGMGFKQLLRTFESARIQTAARAVGVAHAALDQAVRYASERKQFGAPLGDFPRVADKLAMMAAETAMARQVTYFAAREKDSGRRCDLEAGMAKLYAARVAWAAADSNVQIHGGTGFASEHPAARLLADARILSIFEGAAEIQAQVIARRLLDGTN